MNLPASPLLPAAQTPLGAARKPSGRRRSPWRGGLGPASAVSAAALLALGTASPAAAHDQLLSTSPAAGTTVVTAPAELSLSFSGNLITGQGIQNVATVTDEDGHQWQDGEPQVSGAELSAALCEGMPNGEYEVGYRVVYSDGHSEEKSFGFVLEDPNGPESAAPEDCGVPNPDAPVSSDATAGDSASATAATAEPGSGTAGEPSAAATGQGTGPSSDTTAGEATAEDSQAPAPAWPGWVWAAAVGGVLVVVLAMVVVFRKARAIDGGARPSDRPSGSQPGDGGDADAR
jgi:copper resistance protein C